MRKTLIVVLTLAMACSLFCQEKQGAANPPLAVDVVYGAFFRHVLALEDAAAEHDKAGRNGNEVRAFYQQALKLTDREAVLLKQVARDCDIAIRNLDARAKKIIDAARAADPGQSVPPDALDQLRQLDEERIAAINAHMRKLEASLDPPTFKRVDGHVRNVFAKNISLTPLRTQDPKKPPTAP